MQHVQSARFEALGEDDEVAVSALDLASPLWKERVIESLGREGVYALHAKFSSRTRGFMLELVGNSRFQRLRGNQLLAALFTSVGKSATDPDYGARVSQYASDHKSIVFVDQGDSIRIYHFRAV